MDSKDKIDSVEEPLSDKEEEFSEEKLNNLTLEEQIILLKECTKKLKEKIAYKNEEIKYWKSEWESSEKFISNIHARINKIK